MSYEYEQDVDINEILKVAVVRNASDLHVKVGSPPVLRIDGRLTPLVEHKIIMPPDVSVIANHIMNDYHKKIFKENYEADLSYAIKGLARFRVNVFRQRGTLAIVFRVLKMSIESLGNLHLPPILEKLASELRGLILVTGVTGSGKSTTLASMIDLINTKYCKNIITIEDPIEFLYRDKKSLISQREIGSDATGFSSALRAALRQDPDIILVGEMRDSETIETALVAAETGHLVFSTLHTLDATETINRIVSVFPPHQQQQIRIQLATVIKGIVSQRLITQANQKGRLPATEVMVSTPLIRGFITEKERTKEIRDAIASGASQYGMQTFDQSIMEFYTNDLITYEQAIENCSNPDDFALKVSGISSSTDTSWDKFTDKKDVEDEDNLLTP